MLNWYWQVCPIHFFAGEEPTDKTFRVVTYNIYPQVDSTRYDQWQRDMLEEIKRLQVILTTSIKVNACELFKAFVDAWWKNGCGLGLTYSGFGMKLRLDHILYNNKLKNEYIEVGQFELSDHRPLICDFSTIKYN